MSNATINAWFESVYYSSHFQNGYRLRFTPSNGDHVIDRTFMGWTIAEAKASLAELNERRKERGLPTFTVSGR